MPSSNASSSFGNLGNRNKFYEGIAAVKTTLAGATVTIESFVELNAQGTAVIRLTPNDVVAEAQQATDRGLAFRYALKALNPFAVISVDYQGLGHASNGALTLFDPATVFGNMTNQYLIDRAAFLEAKIELGLLNQDKSTDTIHFRDVASNFEIKTTAFFEIDNQQFLFGGEKSETLQGDGLDDHLYGGEGHDVLIGQGGTDYLEGNAGNDTLTGGTGNDELRGGAGFDTYIYNAGDGTDQIEDSDATGRIIFDQKLLQAGIRRTGDAKDNYTSLDGTQTYVISGGHLIVNGVLTVNANFQSGQFGIRLLNLSDMADSTVPTQGPVQRIWTGTPGDDDLSSVPFLENHSISAGLGNDYLDGFVGDDVLYGEGGSDYLLGGQGRDVLYGGDEADRLEGDGTPSQHSSLGVPDQDYLDGGVGDDLLLGFDFDDVLLGDDGADQLLGDDYPAVLYVDYPEAPGGRPAGADYLDGGAGNDLLFAGLGNDELFGGEGNDELRGDNVTAGGWYDFGYYALSAPVFNPTGRLLRFTAAGGADYLEGGAGADVLVGDGGNDILSGGADNGQLYGDDFADDQVAYLVVPGNDILDGGTGDDLLAAGDGNDSLAGGIGIDTLFGDKGDDILDGGADADTLRGGDGADQLFGGGGNDLLFGDGLNNQFVTGTVDGADFLAGGEGDDELQGGAGADLLSGGAGNDFLLGQDDADTLFGDAGADELRGGLGNDFLAGDAGDDVLLGEAGDDTLVGGAGIDVLAGGAGADTYVFNLGDGIDSIQDTAGERNRLVFGAGISADDIGVGIRSLVVRVGLSGDAVHVQGFDPGKPTVPVGIATFEFADGTTLTQADLVARGFDLVGTAGDDVLNGGELYRGIYGLNGDDVLTGGEIDNVLDGGSGNDVMFGNGGVDQLSGGSGDDVMRGGTVEDVLLGGSGEDHLFGEDGDDQLDGGAGTDVMNGGTGQDTYVFGRGSGHDMLRDSPVEQSGPNTIQLTSGISPNEVRLQARRSEDGVNVVLAIDGTQDELTLLGAADPSLLPISQILFADGTSWATTEILTRIEGVHLTASAAGSFLEGTGFRDALIGAQGNDELDGLGDADRMVGGAGDDRYRVDHPGDTVVELEGEGTDTVLSQIDYVLPTHVENLLLRTTDQPATDPVHGEGNASDNLLIGNFVNNVLIGGTGHDTFWGGFSLGSDYGPGDDDFSGGTGNDTYVVEGTFNGFDTIHDVALPGEGNRLQFGTSVRPEDVLFVQEGSSLRITNSGGTDGVVLADFDPNGASGSLVTEVVAFSNGVEDVTGGYETSLLALMHPRLGSDNAETMIGTSGAEVIRAQGGDDVLAGGMGNDVLLGGTGNDTYVFNQGDGLDLIDDQSGTGDTNRVQFGAGITQDMLRVSYNGTFGIGGLSVRIGASGDGLHFLGVSAEDPTGAHAVDTFHFADGTQLTFAQLFEREILVQGTGRSDGELFGTFANDRMHGFGGSESLSGGAGNDQLDGWTGNDTLLGGEGEDTYIFRVGDGFDRIEDDAEVIDDGQGGHLANNRILFGPGITLADLSFVEVNMTIREILVGSNGDGIELPNFVDFSPGLRTVSFSDGLTVDIYDLRDGGLVTDDQTIQGGPGGGVLIGGVGNDVIQSGGGNTALIGSAGNDTLVGGSGHNWISGGPGNDFILGGSGGNTFLLSPGSGRDSIQIPNYQLLLDSSTARFSGGYGSYHPSLSLGSLVIRYGDLGDELHILDFDPHDVFARPAVQRFEFSDRVLTYAELIALGFDINGTGGDDVLTGTNTTDRFSGFAGNDNLSGGAGTDSFIGGQGANTLHGGAGHDIYVFNIGDGFDTIEDVAVLDEGNQIQFGVGITRSDLTFTHDQAARTLTIQVGSSGTDRLLHTNFDPTGTNGSLVASTLAFVDGSTANLADFLSPTVNHTPIIAVPLADQTVPEDEPFNLTIPANTFTDEDASDVLTLSASVAEGTALPGWLSFNATTRTFTGMPDDAQVGSLDLKVTATDQDNLNVSDVFSLTITNVNEAPTVAVPIADQQATENVPFSQVVPTSTFADPDAGDVVTYSATLAGGAAFPTWLNFNATTRTVSGTPLNSDVGTLNIAVKATDLGGLSATDTVALTIQNVNDAPTVANLLADQTVPEDASFNIQVPANTFADPDAIHGDLLTYSASLANGSALPTWLSFNAATRMFSGMPDDAQLGSLDLRVTATDTGNLTVSDVFTLTVTNVNEAPTVANSIADQTVPEDAPFSIQVPANTFADQDANETLTYSASLVNGSALPAWLSFNSATRTFSGTPDDAQVGSLDLRVTATDTGALTVSDTFTLTVTNVNEAPTVAAPLADHQATQGTVFSLVVPTTTFADVDAGDSLTYSATLATGAALLTGLSFNPVTRTFTGTPQAGDVGVLDVHVTATDQGNLSVADVFALTIAPSGGTAGNDILIGTSGNDLLDGLAGDDVLRGLAGNDTLLGGAGSDLLDGGTGTDTMTGGTGNDTYVLDMSGDVVIELANEGTDTVQSSIAYTLGANVENLTLTGTALINGTGNALDNVLTGNSMANTLTGGAGNDTYMVSTGDTVVEQANQGLDTVQSDVTWTLGANLETLTLTGTANINGTGNGLDNLLTGNSGANVLTGGAGNDAYVVSTGDTVVEAANAGIDTVLSNVTTTLSANVELLVLTGTNAINGTGNNLANGITGNVAANMLNGGMGTDTLAGLDGNDTYVVDHTGDIVIELANNGVDAVQSSVTYTLAANVENLTLIGTTTINGTGNTLDNFVLGNNTTNVLTGANGNDILRGGMGNDTMNGGSGNDTFLFGRGDGQDLVQDNSGAADKILYDAGINPLDMIVSRQVNDLRLAIHGSSDQVTVQNWYVGTTNRTETIQAGNGQALLSTQVDQLIQAMAGFTAQTGLTWDQAIDQQPQGVQTVLAASWQ